MTMAPAMMAAEPRASPNMGMNAPRMLMSWGLPCRKTPRDPAIEDQPERGDAHHDARVDGLRAAQPDHARIQDPSRKNHQCERIDESGKHARAMVAVGLGFVGGLGLQVNAEIGRASWRGR